MYTTYVHVLQRMQEIIHITFIALYCFIFCDLAVPDQPNSVMVMATSSSTLTVRWVGPQNTANVDGYVIRYEPSPSVMCDSVSEGEISVTDDGVREWEVTGLEEGVEYAVRVAAFNSIGTGQFSSFKASTLAEGIYI